MTREHGTTKARMGFGQDYRALRDMVRAGIKALGFNLQVRVKTDDGMKYVQCGLRYARFLDTPDYFGRQWAIGRFIWETEYGQTRLDMKDESEVNGCFDAAVALIDAITGDMIDGPLHQAQREAYCRDYQRYYGRPPEDCNEWSE